LSDRVSSKSHVRRAALHAALGDPTRLRIADDLLVSDRSPRELAERLNVSSNLLAHHLDVLEEAGAVQRRDSAGDARRRYVRLSVAAARVLGPPARPVRPDVMFVCTRNSSRSQLASAIWSARTGRSARSAGTAPAPAVHPGALAAAERAGLSIDGAEPRLLGPIPRGTQVITVCDLVHEELRPRSDWWHWSVPSPSGRAVAFDAVIVELEERMSRLGLPPREVASEATHAKEGRRR